MSRPIWKGSLGFSLVNIPVALLSGLERSGEQLHELHRTDGSRIERRLFCSREGIEIERDEAIRAYDHEGEMIEITDAEVESVAPYRSRTIDIETFAPLGSIDAALFDGPYFLVPGDESEGALRAFQLLVGALEDERKAAIARFVLRSRERLAAISPVDDRLKLHTLHYPDELRSSDLVDGASGAVDEKQLEEATRLIERMKVAWDPAKLDDDRAQRIRRLAQEKLARGDLVRERPEPAARDEEEGDVLAALQKSLDEVYGRSGRAGGRARAKRARRPLADLSKEELYKRARNRNLPGRSKMTKSELEKALRE